MPNAMPINIGQRGVSYVAETAMKNQLMYCWSAALIKFTKNMSKWVLRAYHT